MLAKRALSAAAIILGGIALVLAGGWVFTIGVGLILAIASWEYGRMFQQGGYHPSFVILIAGNFCIALASRFDNIEILSLVFSSSILLAFVAHILAYPKQKETAAIDLAATLSGLVFIGFLGSYIVRLRYLPDGLYWLLIAIAPAGISDIGAFLTGNALGRHKMAPELSPHKSIEGYIGGVFTAAITGYATGVISGLFTPNITGLVGLVIGLIVGIFCPLGDLGKSLIKRQFNFKHTSNLIPGHGGVLDRADTLLWAGVIGYSIVSMFYI